MKISDVNVIDVKLIFFNELYNLQNNIVNRIMLTVNASKKKIRVNTDFYIFTVVYYMFISIYTTFQCTITLINTVHNDYSGEFISHNKKVI